MESGDANASERPSPALDSIQKSSFVGNAGNLWREGTEAKFLDSIRDGSLPPEAFQRWLVQDYLFAKGLTTFHAIAVSRAPRSAQKVLIAGLAAMDAELEWFEQTAQDRSLDLNAAHHPTCQKYVDYLIASAYTKPVEVLLAILFGVEVAYLCGWSALDATGPYAEFIARWSNENFLAYVHQIHDVCVSHPHDSQQSQFNEVLRHERDFWKMTYEG
ncbi:MAG: thiaminase [Mariniblastus sp.]|jgi:thiaminase